MSTKRQVSFRTGAIGYLLSCLFAGLSLIVLDSNLCKSNTIVNALANTDVGGMGSLQETCSMSQGGKSTIASTVLFFVAAVGTGLLHPAQQKKDADDGLDEPLVTEEETTSVL